jgi:deoxyribodipyrimidine photolyase
MIRRCPEINYQLKEVPQKIVDMFKSRPSNSIEKAKRYDSDVELLSRYIDELRNENASLLSRLENLSTEENYLNTLKKIQDILNEDVGFPIPC